MICPKCSTPISNSISFVSAVIRFVLVIFVIGLFAVGYSKYKQDQEIERAESAAAFQKNIYDKVTSDSLNQYDIAKQQGDQVQICVQAGLVASAYLQAQQQDEYNQWKATESEDCAYLHQ